ncbi:uncharacterized protein LOC112089706 [Eutrema salsugineum]|uniref:uncharacterized protein LOC112089706 n=1 Tax=Eutrema salsugineum TaxID=72664 RepID=UPI000CED76DF|nr:uncharacterized protein LOC112089706 [Eutrema salsugineum]
MDHIENFEEICSTTGSNGIPADFLKCKLFPFSLADKALRWLKSLPPGSLTTWEECRSAFLDHFYTKAKTAALKNKILSFKQQPGEAFCEAWERNALNAASNGDFMTKSKKAAYELIENLAASSSNKSQEYDRSSKAVHSVELSKIDELTAKVNLLLRKNQRSVHFADEVGDAPLAQEFVDAENNDQMEVNFVNGQGYVQNRSFNNFRNHPNLSYRRNNVENPQDQVYPQQGVQNQSGFQKNFSSNFQGKQFITNQNRFQDGNQQKLPFTSLQPSSSSSNNSQDELKNLMQQLLVNQQKSSMEMNAKMDTMYNDLNGKYKAVWTHVKKLDVQVAQTAEAVKRSPGTLPGKGENPRNEFVNAIELRSGKTLHVAPTSSVSEKRKEKDVEHLLQEEEQLMT